MRTAVRFWRWRRSPLKRRTDIVEAWARLVLALLLLFCAPLAGAVTASNVHQSLSRQRVERHPASAVLVTAPQSVYTDSGESRVLAVVRWTAADGSAHKGTAQVEPSGTAGSRATVWLDAHGRLTGRPLSTAAAEGRADVLGASAAIGVCVVLLAGHGAVRWRLNRLRDRQWERQWARVGPRWCHRLP